MNAVSAPQLAPVIVTGSLAALERDWKQLQQVAGWGNPFLSWEWQSAWAAATGAHALALAQPFRDGTLAGLLCLQRRRRHGLVQMEFLGQGSGGDDLDCLLHPEAPVETTALLLQALRRRRDWNLLRLESAGGSGSLVRDWPRPQQEQDEWLPTLALPATFNDLLLRHSANFRAEVRRRRRRFFTCWPNATIECASTPPDVSTALEHLFRLHNLRRAQKLQAGIFESGRLRAFHRQAAPALAQQGIARVYLLRTEGVVLAALYGMEAGPRSARRFLYFQSGFDPAVTALSPGTVLLSAVIEDCIMRKLRRFDFLRGTESYKSRWTSEGHASMRLLASRGLAALAWMKLRARRRQWRNQAA